MSSPAIPLFDRRFVLRNEIASCKAMLAYGLGRSNKPKKVALRRSTQRRLAKLVKELKTLASQD